MPHPPYFLLVLSCFFPVYCAFCFTLIGMGHQFQEDIFSKNCATGIRKTGAQVEEETGFAAGLSTGSQLGIKFRCTGNKLCKGTWITRASTAPRASGAVTTSVACWQPACVCLHPRSPHLSQGYQGSPGYATLSPRTLIRKMTQHERGGQVRKME